MHLRHTLSLAVAAGLAVAGCSVFALDDDDRICTLVGCRSGLTVELATSASGPFRVEVTESGAAAEGQPRVFECADPARCAAGAFFGDFTPARVTVRVTTPTGTVARELTPVYRTSRPNGEDCPPTCRDATVRVDLAG